MFSGSNSETLLDPVGHPVGLSFCLFFWARAARRLHFLLQVLQLLVIDVDLARQLVSRLLRVLMVTSW